MHRKLITILSAATVITTLGLGSAYAQTRGGSTHAMTPTPHPATPTVKHDGDSGKLGALTLDVFLGKPAPVA